MMAIVNVSVCLAYTQISKIKHQCVKLKCFACSLGQSVIFDAPLPSYNGFWKDLEVSRVRFGGVQGEDLDGL